MRSNEYIAKAINLQKVTKISVEPKAADRKHWIIN
jgi:hypothetical protein